MDQGQGIVAKVTEIINAPVAEVWKALVTPDVIKRYMFGVTVVADWREGGVIVWKGEWKGQPYEDRGVILVFEPEKALSYTHYSPLSGLSDAPEHYHTVNIQLDSLGDRTRLTLTQDNNASDEARKHSEQSWSMMLDGLRRAVQRES